MADLQHPRFACDESFPGRQVLRLARRAIERYRLDLRGLRVLTEASVGYRRATPVIAALAGADEVYAIGRDTAQAARKEAEAQTAYLANRVRIRYLPNIAGIKKMIFNNRCIIPHYILRLFHEFSLV